MKWAWGPSERVKIALVQHLLFLQHPLPLVIPTWTFCHAALDKAACAPFSQEKADAACQRHQAPQEIRGSEAEGPAVPRTLLGNVFRQT